MKSFGRIPKTKPSRPGLKMDNSIPKMVHGETVAQFERNLIDLSGQIAENSDTIIYVNELFMWEEGFWVKTVIYLKKIQVIFVFVSNYHSILYRFSFLV